jgi:hypothetical protein
MQFHGKFNGSNMKNKIEAFRSHLSVYIQTEYLTTECHYIAFPRFSGDLCTFHNLDEDQKQRLNAALETAQEIAERFTADGRFEATEKEILKAFERTFHLHDYWNS